MSITKKIMSGIQNKQNVRNILFTLAIIVLMYLIYSALNSKSVLREGNRNEDYCRRLDQRISQVDSSIANLGEKIRMARCDPSNPRRNKKKCNKFESIKLKRDKYLARLKRMKNKDCSDDIKIQSLSMLRNQFLRPRNIGQSIQVVIITDRNQTKINNNTTLSNAIDNRTLNTTILPNRETKIIDTRKLHKELNPGRTEFDTIEHTYVHKGGDKWELDVKDYHSNSIDETNFDDVKISLGRKGIIYTITEDGREKSRLLFTRSGGVVSRNVYYELVTRPFMDGFTKVLIAIPMTQFS